MNGFYKHVCEAIFINRNRSKLYSSISNGKTRKLSRLLILSEYLTLPIALYFDYIGKKYNKLGIPIVKNDFAPMKINAWDKKPLRNSNMAKKHKKELKSILKNGIRKIQKSINSLLKAYQENLDLLDIIREYEKQNNLHLAMIKHISESMALILKNGIQYSLQSNGKTEKLSISMFHIHLFALNRAIIIDSIANKFHQNRIGIIVNDMPDIPLN